MRDAAMAAAGRSLYGERQPNHKLTEAQVYSIHYDAAARYVTHAQLARLYGVSTTMIRYIVTGRKWRHVYARVHGPPSPDREWACGCCGRNNHLTETVCDHCMAPRPDLGAALQPFLPAMLRERQAAARRMG